MKVIYIRQCNSSVQLPLLGNISIYFIRLGDIQTIKLLKSILKNIMFLHRWETILLSTRLNLHIITGLTLFLIMGILIVII